MVHKHEYIIRQLNLFAVLFTPSITSNRITKLTLQLCEDKVATVRNEAARYVIINIFENK